MDGDAGGPGAHPQGERLHAEKHGTPQGPAGGLVQGLVAVFLFYVGGGGGSGGGGVVGGGGSIGAAVICVAATAAAAVVLSLIHI